MVTKPAKLQFRFQVPGRKVRIYSRFRFYTCNLVAVKYGNRAFQISPRKISEMLKFQQRATPEDLKIAASIEHKRRIEEARKLRIFNPRIRKIGVGIQSRFFCDSTVCVLDFHILFRLNLI